MARSWQAIRRVNEVCPMLQRLTAHASENRVSSRTVRGLLFVCGLAWGCLSCSSAECASGEQRCGSASMPQRCVRSVSDPDPIAPGIYAPGAFHWVDGTACLAGASCVQVDTRTAVCAFASQPVAQCEGGGSICWQGSVAACVGGYPTSAQACDAGTCAETQLNGAPCAYCNDGAGTTANTCAPGAASQ